ncbi:proline rich protein 2 [Strigomonas culicis]|uniref:Proline rich protein 2 n=1 Tax=Strigomonas culicis TaxID=28005 RepID=S9UMV6_9TRYP|nr:proline rich protein 2 [Strigomonas culicis]|eukprot:EPY16026.1 proline rich protein 2 [Strigomonas culicis]
MSARASPTWCRTPPRMGRVAGDSSSRPPWRGTGRAAAAPAAPPPRPPWGWHPPSQTCGRTRSTGGTRKSRPRCCVARDAGHAPRAWYHGRRPSRSPSPVPRRGTPQCPRGVPAACERSRTPQRAPPVKTAAAPLAVSAARRSRSAGGTAAAPARPVRGRTDPLRRPDPRGKPSRHRKVAVGPREEQQQLRPQQPQGLCAGVRRAPVAPRVASPSTTDAPPPPRTPPRPVHSPPSTGCRTSAGPSLPQRRDTPDRRRCPHRREHTPPAVRTCE